MAEKHEAGTDGKTRCAGVILLALLAGCGGDAAVREFDIAPAGRPILEQYDAPCWRMTKWSDGHMWFITWPDGVKDPHDGRSHVIEWRWR